MPRAKNTSPSDKGAEEGLSGVLSDDVALGRIGLLGELAVEMELAKRGWHPVRLDTAQMAANADLLAVNREQRVAIQVKTTNLNMQKGQGKWLQFGYATNYLRSRHEAEPVPLFNAKKSPMIADVVIAVGYSDEGCRFVVIPVGFAERPCRNHADTWFDVKTKSGKQRSPSFPIWLRLTGASEKHHPVGAQGRRNLARFEGKWELLQEPLRRLHSPTAWRLWK